MNQKIGAKPGFPYRERAGAGTFCESDGGVQTTAGQAAALPGGWGRQPLGPTTVTGDRVPPPVKAGAVHRVSILSYEAVIGDSPSIRGGDCPIRFVSILSYEAVIGDGVLVTLLVLAVWFRSSPTRL